MGLCRSAGGVGGHRCRRAVWLGAVWAEHTHSILIGDRSQSMPRNTCGAFWISCSLGGALAAARARWQPPSSTLLCRRRSTLTCLASATRRPASRSCSSECQASSRCGLPCCPATVLYFHITLPERCLFSATVSTFSPESHGSCPTSNHTDAPPLPALPGCSHGVWRLSDSGLLRGEVEDLQSACETVLATANASLATLEERGGDIAGAQLRCVWWLGGCGGGWVGGVRVGG